MTWLPGIWFLVAIYILVLSFSWRARKKKLEDWAQAKGLSYTHLVAGDQRDRLVKLIETQVNRAGKRVEKVHHLMESPDGLLTVLQYGSSLGGRMQYVTLAIDRRKEADSAENSLQDSDEKNSNFIVVMRMMSLPVLDKIWEELGDKNSTPTGSEMESKG